MNELEFEKIKGEQNSLMQKKKSKIYVFTSL